MLPYTEPPYRLTTPLPDVLARVPKLRAKVEVGLQGREDALGENKRANDRLHLEFPNSLFARSNAAQQQFPSKHTDPPDRRRTGRSRSLPNP